MTWKVPVFDMFYVISLAIFEDIDLKFCALIHQLLPSNILFAYCFENFDFEGEIFEKEKMLNILEIFRNFQNFENPR